MQQLDNERQLLIREATAAATTENWQVALKLWDEINGRFPDDATAVAGKAEALRQLGRIADAEQVLTSVSDRFRETAAVLAEWARIAQYRSDWEEASRRWEAFRSSFADRPEGHIGLGAALREMGDFDAADLVLSAAIADFSENPDLRIAHAWVAHKRRDWSQARHRWESIQSSFPELVAGHLGLGIALREQGEFDAADIVFLNAIAEFPQFASVHVEFAWAAHQRADWEAAVDRWNSVRTRFPDNPAGFNGAGVALRELGRFDAAEKLFTDAMRQFPESAELAIGYASIAPRRQDWDEALRRWRSAKARFPDRPEFYAGMGEGLRELRRFDEAEAVLSEAKSKFPDYPPIAINHALVATRQNDWPRALLRWREVCERFPGNKWAARAAADAFWHARLDGAVGDGTDAEMETLALHSSDAAPAGHPSDRDLLMNFESLGSNCEFGIVQRRAGCEPLGLLRWTTIPPEKLIRALREKFSHVAEPKFITVTTIKGEYIVKNSRYASVMHSFVLQRHVDSAVFLAQQRRRISFLRDKILKDLASGEKIFVYKNARGLSRSQISALYQAIRQYGPSTLLCVLPEDAGHANGLVERIGHGLMIGYINRFAPVADAEDSEQASWLAICRAAHRLWTAGSEHRGGVGRVS